MGKEIAEQLRDLGKARSIAVVTASQLRRDGYENKEASMKDTAGSAGLNDTADLMITITQDALMKSHKLYYHMILKNRFGPNTVCFFSKVDYQHMRVSDVDAKEIEAYSSQQVNQDQNIPNFNMGNEMKGSSDIAIKDADNKGKGRGKSTKIEKTKKNDVKEPILDNINEHSSTDDSENTDNSDDMVF
jgi:hypothetical protein